MLWAITLGFIVCIYLGNYRTRKNNIVFFNYSFRFVWVSQILALSFDRNTITAFFPSRSGCLHLPVGKKPSGSACFNVSFQWHVRSPMADGAGRSQLCAGRAGPAFPRPQRRAAGRRQHPIWPEPGFRTASPLLVKLSAFHSCSCLCNTTAWRNIAGLVIHHGGAYLWRSACVQRWGCESNAGYWSESGWRQAVGFLTWHKPDLLQNLAWQ